MVHAQDAPGLRSDTGLTIESRLESDPDAVQSAVDQALELPVHGRERGLWLLLQGKLALRRNELEAADAALAEAQQLFIQYGNARDRSRVGLQRLHVPIRKKRAPDELALQFKTAIAQSEAARDSWAVANAHLLQGYVAALAGNFMAAEQHAQSGLRVAKALPDQALSAVLLNNIGNAQKNLGQLGNALDSHLQALELRQALVSGQHPEEIAPAQQAAIVQSLSNIVLVYQRMEDWPKARQYSEAALERSASLIDVRERLRIALNHAAVLVQDGHSEQSTPEHDARLSLQLLISLETDVESQAPDWKAPMLRTRALAMSALGAQAQALESARQALALARKSGAERDLVESLQVMATVQSRIEPAPWDAIAQQLQEAISLAQHQHTAALERDLRHQLALALERQSDLAGALQQWHSYDVLNREISGLAQIRRIAALEQEVANAERERELQAARSREVLQLAQLSRQRWLGGMGFVTLLAISLALYSRVRYARKREQANERSRLALARENQALERLATTDSLTGLRNRQWMHQQLDRAHGEYNNELVVRSKSGGEGSGAGYALALLDIDHFKKINDTHGHDVGDQVLMRIAKVLEGGLSAGSSCARWGGEEFLLLIRGDFSAAVATLDALRDEVFGHRDWTVPMIVSCSIGVAALKPKEGIAEWLKRADLALYQAKHDGRNQIRTAAELSGPA